MANRMRAFGGTRVTDEFKVANQPVGKGLSIVIHSDIILSLLLLPPPENFSECTTFQRSFESDLCPLVIILC